MNPLYEKLQYKDFLLIKNLFEIDIGVEKLRDEEVEVLQKVRKIIELMESKYRRMKKERYD